MCARYTAEDDIRVFLPSSIERLVREVTRHRSTLQLLSYILKILVSVVLVYYNSALRLKSSNVEAARWLLLAGGGEPKYSHKIVLLLVIFDTRCKPPDSQ
eukprot:6488368-Amphidinium_carterae.1